VDTNEKLINGKNPLKGIVGIEVLDDGQAEIFTQDSEGNIKSQFVNHSFWLLSDTNISEKMHRLDGDLHYKWGHQETNRKEFNKTRSILGNKGVDIYTV
jgi:hypothetical protein